MTVVKMCSDTTYIGKYPYLYHNEYIFPERTVVSAFAVFPVRVGVGVGIGVCVCVPVRV